MSEAKDMESNFDGWEVSDPSSIWYMPTGQTRKSRARKKPVPSNKKALSGKYLMECHCGTRYEAKGADIGRGWGLSCSKSCASIRRDFGRPRAKILNKIEGKSVSKIEKQKTGFSLSHGRTAMISENSIKCLIKHNQKMMALAEEKRLTAELEKDHSAYMFHSASISAHKGFIEDLQEILGE